MSRMPFPLDPPYLLVAATALEAEPFLAAPAANSEVLVAGIGSSGVGALREAMRRLRPGTVVSVGLAGALDPALAPGSLVLASAVRNAEGSCPTLPCPASGPLHAELIRRGLAHECAELLSAREPLHDAAVRDTWRTRTGAAAVDMESYGWAVQVGDRALFGVLRVVSDHADLALPELRHRLLDPHARIRWRRWLWALVRTGQWRQPRAQACALARARGEWRAAMRGLHTTAAALRQVLGAA